MLLIDANSVGGGHAVKAGGFALVDTELQRSKGIADNPDLAFGDWGVARQEPGCLLGLSLRPQLGQRSTRLAGRNTASSSHMILPTNEDSVPRFHFTRGAAVNAVVPLLRQVLYDTNIEFRWNTRAVALSRGGRAH